jgi:hypothetical protein
LLLSLGLRICHQFDRKPPDDRVALEGTPRQTGSGYTVELDVPLCGRDRATDVYTIPIDVPPGSPDLASLVSYSVRVEGGARVTARRVVPAH